MVGEVDEEPVVVDVEKGETTKAKIAFNMEFTQIMRLSSSKCDVAILLPPRATNYVQIRAAEQQELDVSK
jgi:hypothetical protein